MKTLLVVNAGSNKKWFVFDIIKQQGVKCVVINNKKLDLPAVSDWIITDTTNHQAALRAVEDYAAVHPIDGVLTYWEDDVLLTSKIVDALNLRGIPYKIAQRARNKYLFRKFCKDNGIISPEYHLLRSEKDIDVALQKLKFPLVVKPIYGASSAFVTRVDDEKELRRTYNFIKRNISTVIESALHEGTEVLAEEYIDGDEVDVDVLIQNGKIKFYSIADNFKTEEPFFVETGDGVPTILSEDDQQKLYELVDETLEKLQITDGCIHFEAKLSGEKAVPIEVNLRMGGDQVHMGVKEAWGVDLAAYAAKIAVGEYFKIDKPEEPLNYVISRYFLSESSGVLANFDYEDELEKDENVLDFNFYKQVGDSVLVPPEGYENLGWLVVKGSNPNDANDNLDKFFDMVSYSLVEFEGGSQVSKRLQPGNNYSQVELRRKVLTSSSRIEHLKRKLAGETALKVGIAENFYEDEPRSQNARKIEKILTELGYKVVHYDLTNLAQIFSTNKGQHADIAISLTDELNETSILSPHIPALFDMLEIPFIGSNTRSVALAKDAIKTRKILDYHNVPLPEWDYVYNISDTLKTEFEFPVLLKAGFLKSHLLPKGQVVKNIDKLHTEVTKLFEKYGAPILVEELLNGNEVEVSLVGNYPDVKVVALKFASGKNADYDEKFIMLLNEIAVDVYNLLDCSDYGVVKLVIDERNNPYFISIDTNPLLNAESELLDKQNISAILDTAVKRILSESSYAYLLPNSI